MKTGHYSNRETRPKRKNYFADQLRNVTKIIVKRYPEWICESCGNKTGKRRSTFSSWHPGICGWCKKNRPVTQPRDYGYPEIEKKSNKKDGFLVRFKPPTKQTGKSSKILS